MKEMLRDKLRKKFDPDGDSFTDEELDVIIRISGRVERVASIKCILALQMKALARRDINSYTKARQLMFSW